MQPQATLAVADEDKLKSWLKKNAGSARGFSIKTTDGASASIFPPYHFGDDFVGGSMTEDRDEPTAYPYTGLVYVRLLGAKPKGF